MEGLLDGPEDMTQQDRDLLLVALLGGAGMLLAMSGLAWCLVGLINLFRPTEKVVS